MLSFEPRIAVIDDKFEEVKGILDQYRNEGIGVKYFNAHLNNPDPKPIIHYSNLNLVFLDVHFTNNINDYDPTHCAAWIDSLLPENSFYILVLWSKETDKKDEILEELKRIKKEPFLFFAEQKTDYQIKDGWDFQKLNESIELKISNYPELEELSSWKKNVAHSSNLVIGHLTYNILPDNLKKKLQKIILGHGGRFSIENEDNSIKREVLFEALDSVLISNTKGLVPFKEISKINAEKLYQISGNIQTDIDSKLNSWFHFKLHKEIPKTSIVSGLVSEFKSKFLKKHYSVQNDSKIEPRLKRQLEEGKKISDIVLVLNRPCDIAQLKYGKNIKLLSGFIIEEPLRTKKKNVDFNGKIPDSMKVYDHLFIDEERKDIVIAFDFRYAFSISKKTFVEQFDNIIIFNKELFSEIQVEYSNYSSRLGITQII